MSHNCNAHGSWMFMLRNDRRHVPMPIRGNAWSTCKTVLPWATAALTCTSSSLSFRGRNTTRQFK
eukprot:9714801-Lingulodinium_polyedra.AAC.1